MGRHQLNFAYDVSLPSLGKGGSNLLVNKTKAGEKWEIGCKYSNKFGENTSYSIDIIKTNKGRH